MMKLKTIFLCLVLFPALSFSQKTKIYYDIEWKGTDDTNNAAYYRLASFDASGNPVDTVKDYYMSGELQGKGIAIKIDRKNDTGTRWKGAVHTYYRSGTPKGQFYFNKDGKRDSLNIAYYENGRVHWKAMYKNGAVVGKFRKEWTEFGYGVKVFAENFRNGNIYNWPLNVNDKHICKIIKDSGLEMTTLTDEKGVAQAINIPLDTDKSYEISTLVEFKGGQDTLWHGLIWGFSDWGNYLFFVISADGYVRAGAMLEGNIHFFFRDTYMKQLHQGKDRNVLRVISTRRSAEYSVNGKVIYKARPWPRRGNYVGFTLQEGKQTVLFHNLLVKQNLDTTENERDSTKLAGIDTPTDIGTGDEFKGWRGNGSGFFIDPNGYIVTNYHVIAEAKAIQVDVIQGGDRVFLKAKVISTDQHNDLAVLKIDDPNFKAYSKLPYNLKVETSDVASDVFTLGFPEATKLGVEVKFNDGKISSKTGFKGSIETYQVSVSALPGNSGSPLFDYDGNLIGVINSGLIDKNGSVQGSIAYAIKSSYLKTFLESLPEKFNLPSDQSLAPKPLTEKIKALTDYVVMIKIK